MGKPRVTAHGSFVEDVDRARRLAALHELVAAYEAEFGEITDEELAAQRQADAASAIRP